MIQRITMREITPKKSINILVTEHCQVYGTPKGDGRVSSRRAPKEYGIVKHTVMQSTQNQNKHKIRFIRLSYTPRHGFTYKNKQNVFFEYF